MAQVHISKLMMIAVIIFLTYGTGRFAISQLQITPLSNVSGTAFLSCTVNEVAESEFLVTSTYENECRFPSPHSFKTCNSPGIYINT